MITTLPKWPRPSKWWYASFASANRNVRSITGCKRCIVIARFIASKSARLPTLIEPRVMPRPVSNKGSSPARLRQACTNQADMSPHSQRLQRHRDRPRPADLDDAIDAAAIGQLTRLRVPIRRFDVVDHLRCPQCLQPLGFSAVEVVAITRAPKIWANCRAKSETPPEPWVRTYPRRLPGDGPSVPPRRSRQRRARWRLPRRIGGLAGVRLLLH